MVYEFEKLAMNGGEMPSGLSAPDQWMFLSLRLLYASKKSGILGREQGSREKKKLEDAYRSMVLGERCRKLSIEVWNRSSTIVSEYRKNSTIELADLLVKTIEGKLEALK